MFRETSSVTSWIVVTMEILLSPWWRSWASEVRERPFPLTPAPRAASSPGSAWPGCGSPASPHLRSPRPIRTLQLAPSAPPLSPAPPVSVRKKRERCKT